MKSLLIALTLSLAGLAPALAADLPVKAPPLQPAVVAPYDWSGFYVGANVGGGWSTVAATNHGNTTAFGDYGRKQGFNADMSGVIGGGQIGYNFQRGHVVFGIDALLDASGLEGSWKSTVGNKDDQFSTKTDVLTLITGRLGYAWDNVLLYGKGGLAGSRLKVSVVDTVPPATGAGNDTQWAWGWTLGAGLEYAIARQWSAGIEYDYASFGSKNFQLAGTGGGSYLFSSNVRDLHLLMLRVNYRIN
ncbi:MAG TPA: outer membrane beta-barrel protein [Pseudolabrys sp.]|nr:outer membrane beta-barrel protein [Pseudolabrys sp.]